MNLFTCNPRPAFSQKLGTKSLRTNLILAALLVCGMNSLHAQLSGTLSVPSGTYPTVLSAVTALNAQGVGAGGVTFNIAAGYTETVPVGGIIMTATGTVANPIVFQKSGAAKMNRNCKGDWKCKS